jgi:hypothetical protein
MEYSSRPPLPGPAIFLGALWTMIKGLLRCVRETNPAEDDDDAALPAFEDASLAKLFEKVSFTCTRFTNSIQ